MKSHLNNIDNGNGDDWMNDYADVNCVTHNKVVWWFKNMAELTRNLPV